VAGQQWGVIGARQLEDCGVSRSLASRWRQQRRLHQLFPGVHALGHASVPTEGRLVAALLYVGPSAVLSHATAAWWWGLTDREPPVIEVSTTSRASSRAGLIVHRRRHLERTRHRRFPITTLPQTLLDLAATGSLAAVRRALAEADYRRLLDVNAVAEAAGRGKPGSARLREALTAHQPRLAYTRSELECRFLSLCEAAGLPLPELNVRVGAWKADALWRRERLIVELDGYDNHHTPAQLRRDRRKEVALRTAGFLVLRYTWEQVTEQPELVIADLSARLLERAASVG
jgi:predicted transcriptional regulator of viral defense system